MAHPHSEGHDHIGRSADRRGHLAVLALTGNCLLLAAVGGFFPAGLTPLSDVARTVTGAASIGLVLAGSWAAERPATFTRDFAFRGYQP
ncbi:MAG: hypothetical protein OXE17_10415 [Chloroflexi bacterium]|nr:hypothetical protein [Chloroflexota bacterium]